MHVMEVNKVSFLLLNLSATIFSLSEDFELRLIKNFSMRCSLIVNHENASWYITIFVYNSRNQFYMTELLAVKNVHLVFH